MTTDNKMANSCSDEQGSDINQDHNYYADTAYSAKMWRTQPKNRRHSMSGMILLPFGNYRDIDPYRYLYNWHDSVNAEPPTAEEQKSFPIRFDTKKIRSITSTRQFVDVFCTFGGYILLLCSILFALTSIAFYFYSLGDRSPASSEALLVIAKYSLIAVLISVLMIFSTRLPESIGKFLFGEIVPELELNRQTGMVTHWRYVPVLGTKRKPTVTPFSEFVPYLQQMITPAATGAGWSIILMHKDSKKLRFGSYGLINLESRGDALAFWDFMQRYMDIDQPVPDVPLLEESRQDDPTTRQFDQEMNRPARYWGSMTVQQLDTKAFDMQRYVNNLMAGNNLPSYQYDYSEFEFVHVRKSKRKKKLQDKKH